MMEKSPRGEGGLGGCKKGLVAESLKGKESLRENKM